MFQHAAADERFTAKPTSGAASTHGGPTHWHEGGRLGVIAMLVFLIKQFMNVRKAIVGRNEPAQLAWGVAFGVLLGIVPHGNLLAILLLLLLLSLQVNHGIATLAAAAGTLLAPRFDGYSDSIGRYVLTHEDFSRHLAALWQLPLMPWTDLNNTIVMGSFLIGVGLLVPIFLVAYPIFHYFAPKGSPIDGGSGSAASMALELPPQPKADVTPSGMSLRVATPESYTFAASDVGRIESTSSKGNSVASSPTALDHSAIDAAMSGLATVDAAGTQTPSNRTVNVPAEPQVIETRIDVIRMTKRKPGEEQLAGEEVGATDISKADEPMNEALNYLLRQLRDSRQRRAA